MGKGKFIRKKGASGEVEVMNLFRALGFSAHREAGSVVDVQVKEIPDMSVEVKRWGKRDQGWKAAMRQCEAAAKGREPVVFTRQDFEGWYCHVRADFLLGLLRQVYLEDEDG